MNLTPEQTAKLDPNNPIFVVMERIALIQAKMLAQDPQISTHLKEIWKHMQQYEEIAHLLTEEEIGVVFRALQKHTAIELVVNTPSKGKSKKVSASDLI